MVVISPRVTFIQTIRIRVPKIHKWRLVWGYLEYKKTHELDDVISFSVNEFYLQKFGLFNIKALVMDSTPGAIKYRIEVHFEGATVWSHEDILASIPANIIVNLQDRKLGIDIQGSVGIQTG